MTTQILLPLHTYPDGNSDNIVLHARAVARHLCGEVHALVLNADFPPITSRLANLLLDSNELVEGAKARCKERGATLVAALRSELDRHKIRMRCSQVKYFPAQLTDIVSEFSRYYDITILGIGNHDAVLRGTAEEVIFAAGRPVVLVPEERGVQSYDHVAIAWDGSRVAARAVSDAWPFLTKSSAVSILCVTNEKALPPGDVGKRLADYVLTHDVNATVSNIVTADRPIAEALQNHALTIGAGLMVMGGFGHSRMRDFVLGGATNGVLHDLRMPALISH